MGKMTVRVAAPTGTATQLIHASGAYAQQVLTAPTPLAAAQFTSATTEDEAVGTRDLPRQGHTLHLVGGVGAFAYRIVARMSGPYSSQPVAHDAQRMWGLALDAGF